MALLEEIEAAENHLAALKRKLAAASCAEVGHRWVHYGGANAGFCEACTCSTPVYKCEACGDYDYGEMERANVHAACRERNPEAWNEADDAPSPPSPCWEEG